MHLSPRVSPRGKICKRPLPTPCRQQIKAKQASLTAEIESRGMHVTGSVTDLLNALFVTATADHFAELQSLPGVTSVTQMRRFKPTLNRAITNMNGTLAWNAVGGIANAGAGMKIGILDTGIDITHPAFQDPSLTVPSGFPKCSTGFTCASYTNNKVIVARSYIPQLAIDGTTASDQAEYSQPDDYTPRDRFGHGTATAACAAGFTNTGAASSTTGGNVSFTGMAPKAFLGNYKIEGSPGVNDGPTDDIMIQAVSDAVADGMDVISMSFGLPCVDRLGQRPGGHGVSSRRAENRGGGGRGQRRRRYLRFGRELPLFQLHLKPRESRLQ